MKLMSKISSVLPIIGLILMFAITSCGKTEFDELDAVITTADADKSTSSELLQTRGDEFEDLTDDSDHSDDHLEDDSVTDDEDDDEDEEEDRK